jgi:hypothetical protein
MGRKKGKQSGGFPSKSQSALHRRTLYVDQASEADRYRNPTPSSPGILGRGHGYRNGATSPSSSGRAGAGGCWRGDGRRGGGSGDKWSSIFSSSSSSSRSPHAIAAASAAAATTTTTATTATGPGLSRLRRLLEERRTEDRLLDRRLRLRLQRSRMPRAAAGAVSDGGAPSEDGGGGGGDGGGRHEAGWLLSHDDHRDDAPPSRGTTVAAGGGMGCRGGAVVPSLQIAAARALGPYLPAYCACCGADPVGGSLRSLSDAVLSELAISLASAPAEASSDGGVMTATAPFPTTDGAVRALARSGVATGLVLRGAPLPPHPLDEEDDEDDDEDDDDDATKVWEEDEGDDGDARWLSDDGLLALCPRISPARCDHRGVPPPDDRDGAPHREGRAGDRGGAPSSGGDRDGPSSSPPRDDDDDDDVDNDDWESLDFDAGLDPCMSGCFHLRRLELIDIPLASSSPSTSASRRRAGGGISVRALRAVLRSCPGLTHLSLGGCFYNWEDVGGGRLCAHSPSSSSSSDAAAGGQDDDVCLLLCGSQSLASLTRSVAALCKPDGDDDGDIEHLLPQLDFHGVFRENSNNERGDVLPGLNELLPELKVLNVSHCGWVTPGMIVRYILNVRTRCLVSEGDFAYNGTNWKQSAEGMDGHAGTSTHNGGGMRPTYISGNGRLAKIAPSLRHLNVRGCDWLLPDFPHLPSWMEGWRERGLFDGIDLSVDRQVRM